MDAPFKIGDIVTLKAGIKAGVPGVKTHLAMLPEMVKEAAGTHEVKEYNRLLDGFWIRFGEGSNFYYDADWFELVSTLSKSDELDKMFDEMNLSYGDSCELIPPIFEPFG